MHSMHARLPRNFVLEERIERYASHIELSPKAYAGLWAHACFPLEAGGQDSCYDEVRLDLGCGKGAFVCGMAKRHPQVLFVAIDFEPLCVVYTAQHAAEAGLRNVVAVPARGDSLPQIFAPGELSRIYLNFPTPFPRKKEAGKRLVALERLLEYRLLLAEGGELQLKTDSQPLRDFALTQLALAQYEMSWSSDDARGSAPQAPRSSGEQGAALDETSGDYARSIMPNAQLANHACRVLAHEPVTEYEARLTAQGAPVFALAARPGKDPGTPVQTASLSLADYLPEDLESMSYIPYGMEGCVTNLRNQRARRR